MKKIITILIIAALAAALCFTLAACNGTNGSKGSVGGNALDTPEEIYGFSAASAGMLISSMNDGASAASAAETESTPAPETPADPGTGGDIPSEPVIDPVTEELDGYMALVESVLSDGGFSVTTGESDREDYQVKSVVTCKDMNGGTISYTMYYNETLIPDYDDDDDDDRDEIEEEYSIRGIMIIDGEEYRIAGERSSESEPGESEDETEFVVYLSETRRMVVEHSVENEEGEHEREFNYIVYEGRSVIERSTFEYETERGETEIEMTHYKDGVNSVFFFDKETVRGREFIRIRVGSTASPTASYLVHITENADGTSSYTYELIGR